ncbi:AAA family ATPase [Pseudotabrizicola alkalilacus]|uniref:Chromosome segregation protein SMC n=1 Tax=Pseudotabrizicola alkalilacus TaxID=2305252 RepID=A0A411YWL8_9RHOB|nr:chromosome segregation protein SMC [Pseudotabrizicola alkalilacus]RGP35123.1 chromosome segregation protein SMC [Pseudotabrizicola alkalilacus]
MKLRAIMLKDVRRFTDPVRIDGIADGVNVLCAPNEFGKSTVFDALRALFFVPHGSRGKEIGQLRPHAGGAPEVAVEIETPDGNFRISKRWFSKPEARVTRAGVLIAQADQAEAWIAQLLGSGDGGPSGLLWVRQGLTSLADGSNKEQQAALDARRDLLSSVTGEVEAMTGGRRMDAALARCREELGAYATGTGKPRTGGPWAEAAQAVNALTADRDVLARRVEILQSALTDRIRLRRELAEIESPDAIADRRARLEAATAAHSAALAHAEQVKAALQALEAATHAADRAQRDLAALRSATKDHAAAFQKDKDATAQLTAAQDALAKAEQAHGEAVAADDTAQARRQRAGELLGRVQARAAAAAANDRRAELQDRIVKAGAARQAVETATAEASIGPDSVGIDRLRGLAAALTTARALRDSTATRVTMRYAPGREGAVRAGDALLAHDKVHPIHSDTVLHIDGLGALTIHPGEGPEGLADVARAATDLAKALGEFGLASMEEALHAHHKRQEAADRLTGVRAELAAFAPKSIEDLQQQLATLPIAMAEDHADLPVAEEAEAELQASRGQAAECTAIREAVRERRDTARTTRAEAAVRQEAAAERLETARAALKRLASQDEAELAVQATNANAAREQAEARVKHIRATAPDIAATDATLKRVKSVEDAARDRIDALRPSIAALTERIAGNAGEAVEEQLQETDEKLEVARDHLARVEREVKVLQRLQAALEGARSEARDRYFEPIAAELRPLLHLLWPEAELNWADDSLLPQSLTRNGQVEPVDILSGGTQEQIAFLVRLAFARLLAKGGRHAPVILDDALVFTDDDRIERMFDALHQQAGDLQIIVLSCRQRAFRELGGKALQITAEAG